MIKACFSLQDKAIVSTTYLELSVATEKLFYCTTSETSSALWFDLATATTKARLLEASNIGNQVLTSCLL